MRVLLTNDDGIYAEGLRVLRQEMSRVAEVIVVAPDRPRSATGHAITLHKPLRLTPTGMGDGFTGYATNGTPSDCVVMCVHGLLGGEHPDLVVSGINAGPNLGEDLTYSGTVSAAMEGTLFGIPSFAISVASYEVIDYLPAARFAARLAQTLSARRLPDDTFLNVNVPPVAAGEIRGVAITRQGRRRYEERLERRIDPRGREYFWVGGDLYEEPPHSGTDVEAVAQDMISVTPIQLDLTNDRFLEELHSWRLST